MGAIDNVAATFLALNREIADRLGEKPVLSYDFDLENGPASFDPERDLSEAERRDLVAKHLDQVLVDGTAVLFLEAGNFYEEAKGPDEPRLIELISPTRMEVFRQCNDYVKTVLAPFNGDYLLLQDIEFVRDESGRVKTYGGHPVFTPVMV